MLKTFYTVGSNVSRSCGPLSHSLYLCSTFPQVANIEDCLNFIFAINSTVGCFGMKQRAWSKVTQEAACLSMEISSLHYIRSLQRRNSVPGVYFQRKEHTQEFQISCLVNDTGIYKKFI